MAVKWGELPSRTWGRYRPALEELRSYPGKWAEIDSFRQSESAYDAQRYLAMRYKDYRFAVRQKLLWGCYIGPDSGESK